MSPIPSWRFTGPDAAFHLDDPHKTSYLYFPLVNEAGMMSVVTPTLHGDAKTGLHSFLLLPVSVEDLHANRAARNFWVTIAGAGPWSVTGNSAAQVAAPNQDQVSLDAGFLWHRLTRENARLGLRAVTTSFVPSTADPVELMEVVLTNTGGRPLDLTPTAAIPIFGRSADNLRDHRHVTSLLHRIHCHKNGVLVRPVLSFDERGHHPNTITYAVLGAEGDGAPPDGLFPVVEDFIGEGGTLDWPAAVTDLSTACQHAGDTVDGYEAMGGLRFRPITLAPGESHSYILILAILPPPTNPQSPNPASTNHASTNTAPPITHHPSLITLLQTYASSTSFASHLTATQAYWQQKISTLQFAAGDEQFNLWLKWVAVQPTLRRLFGNSYLPYHDYGRGGRGWRDLWQDILALLLMESGPVDGLLFGNYAGVRLDGSNATIIGSQPGEFKADRNNIPRVWMDHGLWPLTTTQLYIDQTGDLGFLLRQQAYFKDSHIHRCRAADLDWSPERGTTQRTIGGEVYLGSILEHLLVQHLTAFFNVGEHNNILLEGADWNDGMDMARRRGESVAFTAFYASNLRQLSRLVRELEGSGTAEITLMDELLPLLDRLHQPVDYASPQAKQARLAEYFASVGRTVSGVKVRVSARDLAADLEAKANWLAGHLRNSEWITDSAGFGWFNGYYDDDGARLEGDHPLGTRMTLTGQVFALMGAVATDEQAREVLRAANRYLYDARVGGYRLNTDFGKVLLNMGRCFGYAFGHKENGAMFSHMAVMFAYALYERGFVREAYQTLETIYRQSVDFPTSRMYPGIPEYFSERGRGMYPYLTGSASWYLLTLVTQAFGVRGSRGDLLLAPRLVKEQFDSSGTAALTTLFAGRSIKVVYHNPARLDAKQYRIKAVRIAGRPAVVDGGLSALIPRAAIAGLPEGPTHEIHVELG